MQNENESSKTALKSGMCRRADPANNIVWRRPSKEVREQLAPLATTCQMNGEIFTTEIDE
jgi:hypothetical protein